MTARICIGIAAALLSATLPISASHATQPGQNGKITFSGRLPEDANNEIYTMNPDGTGLTRLTDAPGDDMDPSWSTDGTKLVFVSQRDADLETCAFACTEIYSMNADGTGQTRLTTTPGAGELVPAWSPDGTQIAFVSRTCCTTDVFLMNADGTDAHALFTGGRNLDPTWSPDGDQLAIHRSPDNGRSGTYVGNHDGTGLRFVGIGEEPDWSPYNDLILVRRRDPVRGLWAHSADDDRPSILVSAGDQPTPSRGHAWSPDMEQVAAALGNAIVVMRADGTDSSTVMATDGLIHGLDWLAIPAAVPGYPRPKGATPLRVSLVPAYRECTAPDREHGPPLEFPSCSGPVQASSSLTVGTPDANGQGSRSTGSLTIKAMPGNAVTNEDEADVGLALVVTDVRRRHDLSDFTGSLTAPLDVRMTDKYNGCCPVGGPHAATGIDEWLADVFVLGVPCAVTADPDVGATCSTSTSIEAIVPAAVREGVRATWQLGPVQVFRTGDTQPFAVQGVFVP